MTWLIYDGIVAAILFICFIVCWKKGLMSSLVGLIAVAASAAAAYIFSGMLAPLIYDAMFKDKVAAALESASLSSGGGIAWIDNIVKSSGGLVAAQTLVEGVVRVVVGIILFLVVSLILSLAAKAFTKVNDVPVLGALNRLLGGALGLVVGLCICLVIATVCALVVASTGNNLSWLNVDIIDKTYLFSILYRYNLLVFI